MIHLRLTVPVSVAEEVERELCARPGVAHVARLQGASSKPAGDLLLCDVTREAANDLVEWLQDRNVHHDGAIAMEATEAVVSDAAAAAAALAPGEGGDSLVWEELEARTRDDGQLSASFLVFMAIASVIAGIGILLDSPILIVGAMVVGPEYGPVSAICVAAVRRRTRPAVSAIATLATGVGVAAVAAVVATVLFRLTGLAPERYDIGERELTAFIAQPDGMAFVVAVLAGIVGMLSLTQARAGALIGVLVSVTTIPAVANVGVATAYAAANEVGGALLQLALNLAGLLLSGIATLAVQSRLTARRTTAARA